MTVSILVVDDETDVADLFRQQFRREVRQGQYAMHFASSGEGASRSASIPVTHQESRGCAENRQCRFVTAR